MAAHTTRRRSRPGWRSGRSVRLAIAVGASTSVAALGAPPSWATTPNPYSSSSTLYGYDVSYPQCSGTLAPSKAYNFAIVGTGGGRPFTSNSCAGAEVTAASAKTSNVALYFNTGYAGAYARNILPGCATEAAGNPVFGSLSGHTLSQDEKAWEIGCSEALYAQESAPTAPTMWWADVETGNSWSTNTQVNDFTLDGLSYQMENAAQATPGGGGFYSYASAWAKIAGADFVPNPTPDGDWLAMSGGAFNKVPIYVTQTGTSGGIDTDKAP